MIDFAKINSFHLGQRHSFEELVCQLARLESFPVGSVFKRVEGAGGDGGVEAYWTKLNGKKTGYQAKYFLRSGAIDWGQIDESVKQALVSHAELECYVVALPCDLTDRTGAKGRGKTGWEHWESHKAKWQKEAAVSGVGSVDFHVWTSNELVARLVKPKAEGLLSYFFGEVELSNQWFKNHVDEAIRLLDERFHPEDHVDVHIEKLFSVISRTTTYKNELLEAFSTIEKLMLSGSHLSKLSQMPQKSDIGEWKGAFSECLEIKAQIDLDLQHQWHTSVWDNSVNKLLAANSKLQEWFWEYYHSLKKDSPDIRYVKEFIKFSQELKIALELLSERIRSRYMKAEQKFLIFVKGKAGSGKSHLLARCAQNALGHNQPTILLLGQRFNGSDLWLQISQSLGCVGYSTEKMLGALDAAGKARDVRTLLLIDAVNEGAGSRYWRNNLASLIHKLKGYSHICCVISCRSEYFELAIPKSIAEQYSVFEVYGFETFEEQLNAAHVYLDRRGIARPSTNWLAPEFVNPLFLRSVCVSLERDKKSEFPVGLTGTKSILKYYLESLARNIQEKEQSTVSFVAKISKAVSAIAGKMLEERIDFLTLESALAVIADHFKNINPTTESDWLSVFLNNGLLRKDPNPLLTDAFTDDEDVVRFSFQRFQDFLMAERALEGLKTATGLFDEQGKLGFCLKANELAWEWRGLLDALAVALPEKLQVELVDVLPGGFEKWWRRQDIRETFIESIKWRSHSAFSERTLKLLNSFGKQPSQVFQLIIQVSVSAYHPWNAEFIHKVLWRLELPKRDAFWTVWLNNQYSDEGYTSAVDVLIDWCWKGQVTKTNAKNQFLAALMLCWFFTSSNRVIRDKSTKALTNLLLFRPALFPELLNRFAQIDDLYVLERLLAAAYGACCRDPQLEKLGEYAQVIFDLIFKSGSPPYGILLRDYAFGVVELATYHSALPETVNFELCKPPYKSLKPEFSITEEEIDEIAKVAGDDAIVWSAVNSMGDFANYEIGPKVSHFLDVALDNTRPLTIQQKAQVFKNEVVELHWQRKPAFEHLENTANPYKYGLHSLDFSEEADGFPFVKTTHNQTQVDQWQRDLTQAESSFLSFLSDEEIARYHAEAAPHFYQQEQEEFPLFELVRVRCWVAKRAYDYGWTTKLGHALEELKKVRWMNSPMTLS